MEDEPLNDPDAAPSAPGRRLTPIHGGPSGAAENSVISKVTDPDLATKTADMVDSVVDVVRNRVVSPIERAATYVILAIFSLFAGSVLLVLLCVGLFRLLMMLLNIIPGGPHEWAAYLIMGGIFLTTGMFMMRKRRNIKPPGEDAA
ncbi:MAG: hypothetical protein DCC49_09140 [Acidobacteria bacterium]|nr:MAG: hypothetical protein DCC49_09140 [Acidobacteriota bacterium]